MKPLISYILVTYNSRDHFPSVFKNLRKYTPYPHEIIIVDNASRSQKYLRGDQIYTLESNTYFTHGVNVGLSKIHPQSDYIVLVNPDIRIFPSTIPTLLNEVKASGASIAGSLLIRKRFRVQHGGGTEYPHLSDTELMAVNHHTHFLDKIPLYKAYDKFPRECRWVTGAFFLITRTALEILGPLNERYPHYKSDLEYCLRAKKEGMKIICSSAICLHYGNRSSKQRTLLGSYYTKIRYSLRWHRYADKITQLQRNHQSKQLSHSL